MSTESRIRAAQVLHGVFGQGSRVPDIWDEGLSPEDAGLSHAILGCCLRRWGRIQTHVRPRLKNPDRGLPLGTQVALAIGIAQLAWLPGVSDHAAVNEAVELAGDRTLGFPPHVGLVNALLRADAKDREKLRATLEDLPASLDRTPFVERVLQDALAPVAEQERIEALWARVQEPTKPSFISLRAGALPEGLAPDADLPECLHLEPGASFPRTWLSEGRGMVQDRSSQALMGFHWDHPVRRVLDACAAPGGKTTALSRRWPEAELIAVEQHPRRARRLTENLTLRGAKAQVIVEDVCEYLRREPAPFDVILLDAPCSGSGTLSKHPELAWLGDELDLERLTQSQRSILEAALPRLAPGGLLIYAVCSWLREEALEHLVHLETSQRVKPLWIWPDHFRNGDLFKPDPLRWTGEGFQAFAIAR